MGCGLTATLSIAQTTMALVAIRLLILVGHIQGRWRGSCASHSPRKVCSASWPPSEKTYRRRTRLLPSRGKQSDCSRPTTLSAKMGVSWAYVPGCAFASDTFLNHANLSEANLAEANLHEAKLVFTNLCWADLTGANLREANLFRADLSWASLNETVITAQQVGSTRPSRDSL
jgi:hypothetical protein